MEKPLRRQSAKAVNPAIGQDARVASCRWQGLPGVTRWQPGVTGRSEGHAATRCHPASPGQVAVAGSGG
ncbi:hypothetical protein [Thalassospira sp.]|uniref:hypothetical protein n=1 Tax=Thalassospira sp. TaxID=1912094 RepID=UPI0027343EA0|nr:hypothetical protein [Thalassospira sp.]MDP2697374.1 hypothetical protein [Thalassospira sp.]